MATTRITTLVLVLGVGAAALTIGLTAHQDDPQSSSKREELGDVIRGLSGEIDVSGTIVDQDGEALNDVEVEVAEVGAFDMFGNLTNRKTTIVDGRFRIRRSGVTSIECRFLRSGYYVERRSFSFSGRNTETPEGVLSESDVVIVLREKPDPAPLDRLEGFLQSDISVPISVLYTKNLPLSDTPLSAKEIRDRNRLDLSRPHVYLVPDLDSDDRLSRVLIDKSDVGGHQEILSKGWIGFSQPESGDGFVEATILQNSSLVGKRFREMTFAPLTGYKPRLLISADSGEDYKFFYCRIQGHYGKGAVTNLAPISENGDVERTGAKIIIYLNPTGSRDVSYIHP